MCRYKHDVHICRVCSVVCYSVHVYDNHIKGQKHLKKVTGTTVLFHCSICKINVPSRPSDWSGHVEGKRHIRAAARQAVSPVVEPQEPVTPLGHIHCNICKIDIVEDSWARHTSLRSHQRKVSFSRYEAAFEEAEKDKHGVVISHGETGADFGIVELENAQQGVSIVLTAQNTVPLSKVALVEAKFFSTLSNTRVATSFSVSSQFFSQSLLHRQDLRIAVKFQQSHRGQYEDRLEMVFKDTILQQQFVIVRLVKAIVGSQADHDLLKPKSPYVPRKHTTREPEREVVPGVPPESKTAIPYVVKLPRAEIPNRISSALSKGSSANIITFFRQSALPSTLDNKTHSQHFKALIWAEEHRTELDLAIYDINGTQLKRHNRYYYLAVPGLAEKRPSVLVGDVIMVHPHDSLEGKWYKGYVHVVHREEVGLCLNGSYVGHSESQRYNIRFKLNRIPLRRQHQALDTAFYPDRILFPLVAHVSTVDPPSVATMKAGIHNKLIANNPAQLQAVTSIVYHPAGAPPFVVFGPPGTGKTVTIVEAIMQLINHNPQARILACAPSNSAADLIASRLINKLSNAELFRFYAPSRFKDQVPDALLTYSYRTASGHHSVPPVATLKRYRVIVSTCVSAGFTYGVGMPRGHFSHIFVDEAGQATEPEVMIAVKTMAENSTNVVLSGDPKQLGPIIRSPIARELGLEISYLERLMQRQHYDEQAGYGKSVVKLVQNFRSHENILRFPNERFYHGDLRPCGDAGVINSFIGSSILVSKNFPIIVHAISGRDLREASSPSFFNIDEVTQVKEYVQLLRADRRVRITDADIGVIAPYHAQCQKIRAVLRPIADGVKVGSVEEFQGQERRVIIISTVRSSREFVKYDLKHTLGFVANPRRFNVAVTRAQALLIVVGDPSVLSLDPLWRSFLNYAHINGGWRGNAPSWDTLAPVETGSDYSGQVRESRLANMDDFARRMEALTLKGVADGVLQDDDLDVNVDRPWREVE